MRLAQHRHLRRREPAIGEQSALLQDRRDIRAGVVAAHQPLIQRVAHGQDAQPHRLHLIAPARLQFGAAQDIGHQRGAMRGRRGIQVADHALALPDQALRLARVARHHQQRAHTFPIQREILRERHGHEQRQPRIGENPRAKGILLDAIRKPLVGQVDERDQPVLAMQPGQLAPLRGREVHAGGVVAASVQHRHRTRRQRAQRRAHAGEIQPASRRVVIRIIGQAQPGGGEHARVVGPARRAEGHRGAGRQLREQFAAHAQRARAAQRVDRRHAPGGHHIATGAEHQGGGGFAQAAQPLGHDVRPVRRAPDQVQLGIAHRVEQRNAALGIVVHADAEIDLLRPRIGGELLDGDQHGVQRHRCDAIKQGHAVTPSGRLAASEPAGKRSARTGCQ